MSQSPSASLSRQKTSRHGLISTAFTGTAVSASKDAKSHSTSTPKGLSTSTQMTSSPPTASSSPVTSAPSLSPRILVTGKDPSIVASQHLMSPATGPFKMSVTEQPSQSHAPPQQTQSRSQVQQLPQTQLLPSTAQHEQEGCCYWVSNSPTEVRYEFTFALAAFAMFFGCWILHMKTECSVRSTNEFLHKAFTLLGWITSALVTLYVCFERQPKAGFGGCFFYIFVTIVSVVNIASSYFAANCFCKCSYTDNAFEAGTVDLTFFILDLCGSILLMSVLLVSSLRMANMGNQGFRV